MTLVSIDQMSSMSIDIDNSNLSLQPKPSPRGSRASSTIANINFWRQAFILGEEERKIYTALPDDAMESIVDMFYLMGLEASQALVRSACLAKDKSVEQLNITVKEIYEHPKVTQTVRWKNNAIKAISMCNELYRQNPPKVHFDNFSKNFHDLLQGPLENAIKDIDIKDSSLAGRVSVLIYTETLLQISEVYLNAIYMLLSLSARKSQAELTFGIIDLCEDYRLILSKLWQSSFLNRTPAFRSQMDGLLRSCGHHISAIYKDYYRCENHPMVFAPPRDGFPKSLATGTDVSMVPQESFASLQDMLQAIRGGINLSLGVIALKKNEQTSRSNLPNELQHICEKLERLISGEKPLITGKHTNPMLLTVQREPNYLTGNQSLRIVYRHSFDKCSAYFSLLATVKDGQAAYMEFDGKFFGLKNDSDRNVLVNNLLSYAVASCYAKIHEQMIKPDDFHFQARPECVHFRWVIPMGDDREKMVSFLELHLQRMVHFITDGIVLPALNPSRALADEPRLIDSILLNLNYFFTTKDANYYFRGLIEHFTRENIDLFLKNHQRILSGVDLSHPKLKRIFKDLAVLDYVWEKPFLPHYLRFLARVHSTYPDKQLEENVKRDFNQLLKSRREFFKEHFYDIVNLGNATQDREELKVCRDVLSLYYADIEITQTIVNKFDKRMKGS